VSLCAILVVVTAAFPHRFALANGFFEIEVRVWVGAARAEAEVNHGGASGFSFQSGCLRRSCRDLLWGLQV